MMPGHHLHPTRTINWEPILLYESIGRVILRSQVWRPPAHRSSASASSFSREAGGWSWVQPPVAGRRRSGQPVRCRVFCPNADGDSSSAQGQHGLEDQGLSVIVLRVADMSTALSALAEHGIQATSKAIYDAEGRKRLDLAILPDMPDAGTQIG